MNVKKISTTTFIVLSMVLASVAQDARDIIRKMDDNMQGNSNTSEMKMSIVRPSYTRTIAFKNWSLGRDYFMTMVTAPAKEKGQVFMKFKTEMWSFNPSINRMIKLPPSMMSQGWMGSDYSNDDLVKQTSIVDDYDQKIVAGETIDGQDCYKIEMIPHPESDIVWGKVLVWVTKDKYLGCKLEYYDDEMFLVRTETAKNAKQFGKHFVYTYMEILPAEEPSNKTIIEIDNINFDAKVEESFFTQQNMKRVR